MSLGSKLAGMMFKRNDALRVSLYDVIIQSLGFGINIKMTFERRIDKHKRRHEAKGLIGRLTSSAGNGEMGFLEHTNEILNRGGTFSESVDGWVTDNELMLIQSGGDGELRKSLEMGKELLVSIQRIKSSLKSKMTYPIVLFLVLNILIYAFANKMLPILVSLKDPETWEGSALDLYNFLMYYNDNGTMIYTILIVTFTVVMKTLSIWTGKVRDKFDSFVPWSIYKEFNAGIFLISLSTLMKSGMTLLTALENLKSQSPRYVATEIDKMIQKTRAAESNAGAINTGFLGEIGDEIEDMAEFGGFEGTLLALGEKSVDQIIENIGKKGDRIKSLMMALVFGFVGWGYGTFIGISQSITDNV
jgi:type II secretory pathway component PulF